MDFAQRLDKIMKERNISNYEMSKKTGISDSLIGYWRKGERTPKADNIINISNFLEVSTDYLLGKSEQPTIQVNNNNTTISGKQENTYNAETKEIKLDEISAELLEQFRKLSFKDKAEIMIEINKRLED